MTKNETRNKQLETKYYPLCWKIEKGNIVIWDNDDKELNPSHILYTIETDFIKTEISQGRYEGEICCM